MANKHLKVTPHKTKKQPNAWWYEESWGVLVIVHRDAMANRSAAAVTIPWKQIRAALKRKDK